MMNKQELLNLSIREDRWKDLSWRLTVFNYSILPEDHIPTNYDINYSDGVAKYYLDGSWLSIDDAVPDEALYGVNEAINLEVGMWRNTEVIETSVGRIIANFTLWYYSFGDRFDFVNDDILPDDWFSKHIRLAVDDDAVPIDGSLYITATEIGKYTQGILELKALAKSITPTATDITLETHPRMAEYRAELLAGLGDVDIKNPSKVADVIAKLDELDKEWLSQDESILYYDSPKARNRRRKLYVIEGISSAFKDDGTFTLQPDPLMGRWKKDTLVAKNNETREGSYQRGAETAKGGEKVTFLQGTFQDHTVTHGDCGAKPLLTKITKYNGHKFIGLNAILNNKKVTITKDVISAATGSELPIRRSFLCKMAHIDVCSTCANDKYAESPHAISNEESSIGSYTMYGAMSAMHAVDLKVAEFIISEHIY